MAKKIDAQAQRIKSEVSRINRLLPKTKALYFNKEGSTYTVKSVDGQSVSLNLTARETEFVLGGFHECAKLLRGKTTKKD